MKITWLSNTIFENRKNGYNNENAAIRQELKLITEEFMGWLDIIENLKEKKYDSLLNKDNQNKEELISNKYIENTLDNIFKYSISDEINGYSQLYIKSKNLEYSDNTTSHMTDKLANLILKKIMIDGISDTTKELINNKEKLIEWYISQNTKLIFSYQKQLNS